ncbi:hypothetical protein AMJ44_13105 [candidate division WOR-1 bacterium DG_54_3]|uniref:Uncharacterized protein n=1 Tax=candidate division WOR-1 bacterium DG_54_3 TaxID=1703775 RepID=A0A0S7XPW6_UNCSA|nr:MAG: hypothetical protein AMJ44_13105 [candidate division WOR-1 bacterium DG_54_3]
MGIFLAVLIVFLALHSLWLNLLLDRRKHKKARKRIEIIVIILMLVAVGWNYYRQKEEIKEQNQLWLSQNDSLKVRLSEISKSNKELTALLEPFVKKARMNYPGWNDQEALQKLASDISKMQPKLIFLGQTEPRRDSVSNLFHTAYGFRSEPTTGLSDVKIRIRFDGRFVTINGGKRGDIVEGGGSMIIDPDSMGFYYTARYLREGNDIEIKVTSKSILKILLIRLWPYPDK